MNTKSLSKTLDKMIGKPLTLGSTLNSIRLCDEMTLKEFAEILKISASYLSDLEHGRKVASPKKAYEYAEKLGYSAKEFVRLALQDETNSFMVTKGLHANVMLEFA